MSSAVEPDVVNSTFCARNRSSIHALHRRVNAPSPQMWCAAIASAMYSFAFGPQGGTLNGILISLITGYLFPLLSLNRHALGKVARVVHIKTLRDTDIICHQLQRYDGQRRGEVRIRFRHVHPEIHRVFRLIGTVGR